MFLASIVAEVGVDTGVGTEVDIGVAATDTAPIVLAGGELSPTVKPITLTRMFSEDGDVGDVGTNSKTGQRGDLPRLTLLLLHLCVPVQFQWPHRHTSETVFVMYPLL